MCIIIMLTSVWRLFSVFYNVKVYCKVLLCSNLPNKQPQQLNLLWGKYTRNFRKHKSARTTYNLGIRYDGPTTDIQKLYWFIKQNFSRSLLMNFLNSRRCLRNQEVETDSVCMWMAVYRFFPTCTICTRAKHFKLDYIVTRNE